MIRSGSAAAIAGMFGRWKPPVATTTRSASSGPWFVSSRKPVPPGRGASRETCVSVTTGALTVSA